MTTYYVKPNGWASPWTAAANPATPGGPYQVTTQVGPGDTVVFLAGYGPYTGEGYHIRPLKSGEPGAPITFMGEPGQQTLLRPRGQAVLVDQVGYINIQDFRFEYPRDFLDCVAVGLAGIPGRPCHHVTLRDCYFDTTYSRKWSTLTASTDLHDIKIQRCKFVGSPDPYVRMTADQVFFNAGSGNVIERVLVEDCDFAHAVHHCLEFEANWVGTVRDIIVRNTRVYNPIHGVFGIYSGCGRSVVDNCQFLGGSVIACCYPPEKHCRDNRYGSLGDRQRGRGDGVAAEQAADHSIFRRSLISQAGMGYYAEKSHNTRVYHNVVWNNGKGLYINTSQPVYDYVFKNNVWAENDWYVGYDTSEPTWRANMPLRIGINHAQNSNLWDNDCWYTPYAWNLCEYVTPSVNFHHKTVSQLAAVLPQNFQHLIYADPRFVGPKAGDFHLRPSSPLRNAGAWLTRAKGTGANSTQLVVEDSVYFHDGLGLIEGDLIQFQGQTEVARVVAVDPEDHVLTLDTPLSWSDGVGVSLPYEGLAPDVGMYQFDHPTKQTQLRMSRSGDRVRFAASLA